MSLPLIRKALEQALDAMTPALPIVWQNVDFEPPGQAPYQQADLLMGEPGNDEYGRGSMQQGYLQVTLAYLIGKGPGDADARAQAIVEAFYRGRTLVASTVIVTITRTPHVMPGYRDGDRWRVPVRIRFHCQIAA